MTERQVVVTGIGLITPLGDSLASFGAALLGSVSPIAAVTTRYARPLAGARVTHDVDSELARSERTLADRSTALALGAASRALQDAGWAPSAPALQRCGVFVGCGTGAAESLQVAYDATHQNGRVAGLTLLRCLPNAAASAISIRHGLRGPVQTYASACASSTLALGEAMRAIRHGYLDLAIAGGTEAPFGDTTIKAWDALRVLAPLGDDPRSACRPFDRSRRGLVLGEGAVFFVLESALLAERRGAHRHARLAGYATSGDGHHWTEPDAGGQVTAMIAAIDDAGLTRDDIGAINAHGTGTPVGDQVEAASIAAVFGGGPDGPVVSSTKALHGHLLGASGAIELAASVVTLQTDQVPPTLNLQQTDDGVSLRFARGESTSLRPGSAVLSNSFAFGGSNACLVVSAT